MDYKLLVLDIDGTLTNSEKKITEPTKEALLRIQEKGMKVAIASGRPTPGTRYVAETLELERFGNYVLSFNGARIINYATKEIVLDKTIQLAKEKKYTKFRLYTDEFAKSAHKLYKSRGMADELYDNEDDKDEYFEAKIYIHSLSLTDEPIDLWNNKILGLKEQGEKEHLNTN